MQNVLQDGKSPSKSCTQSKNASHKRTIVNRQKAGRRIWDQQYPSSGRSSIPRRPATTIAEPSGRRNLQPHSLVGNSHPPPCFAYQTGAVFNPSRDFGPRLALLALGYGRQLFTNPYWFYGPFATSLTGCFMGGFLYDFMIFTGEESPVNYPLDGTKRPVKKSRAKWSRRLHLTPKKAKGKMVQ